MKTLAIVNQKGGVWKTTTAVTVAHGLALCNLDVLLVDLDAQGNVADCLGMKKGPGLHDFLMRGAGLQAITESGRPHLDVIMGDPMTAEMKRALAGDPFGIFKLRDALVDVASEYDVCVLDADALGERDLTVSPTCFSMAKRVAAVTASSCVPSPSTR